LQLFGLGRYFYDFDPPWVDIDDKSRPKKSPALVPWMIPVNWRKGQRVGKGGSEFAASGADEERFKRSCYLDCAERQ
jgi:hypothetical protein